MIDNFKYYQQKRLDSLHADHEKDLAEKQRLEELNSKATFESNMLSMNNLVGEKGFIESFKYALGSIYLESLLFDKEFIEKKESKLRAFIGDYIEENFTRESVQVLSKKNPIAKSIYDVCIDACNKITERKNSTKDSSLDFSLVDGEKENIDKLVKNYDYKTVAELVKDKVSEIVMDEKTNAENEESIIEEIKSKTEEPTGDFKNKVGLEASYLGCKFCMESNQFLTNSRVDLANELKHGIENMRKSIKGEANIANLTIACEAMERCAKHVNAEYGNKFDSLAREYVTESNMIISETNRRINDIRALTTSDRVITGNEYSLFKTLQLESYLDLTLMKNADAFTLEAVTFPEKLANAKDDESRGKIIKAICSVPERVDRLLLSVSGGAIYRLFMKNKSFREMHERALKNLEKEYSTLTEKEKAAKNRLVKAFRILQQRNVNANIINVKDIADKKAGLFANSHRINKSNHAHHKRAVKALFTGESYTELANTLNEMYFQLESMTVPVDTTVPITTEYLKQFAPKGLAKIADIMTENPNEVGNTLRMLQSWKLESSRLHYGLGKYFAENVINELKLTMESNGVSEEIINSIFEKDSSILLESSAIQSEIIEQNEPERPENDIVNATGNQINMSEEEYNDFSENNINSSKTNDSDDLDDDSLPADMEMVLAESIVQYTTMELMHTINFIEFTPRKIQSKVKSVIESIS